MRPLPHALAFGLGVLAGCTCTDRTLEEQESPPDIDGLCQAHCERVMECVWTPDSSVSFNTVEGCFDNCRESPAWNTPDCAKRREALLTCITQYECPEFASYGCATPQGHCCTETMQQSCP